MRTAEQLDWYRYLVHSDSLAGSLFTLLHLPFMVAFVSLVALGALPLSEFDPVILLISMVAVALALYGEHMLDDTTGVGKPWDTVLTDRSLITLAIVLFSLSSVLGGAMAISVGSLVPLVGVLAGVMFSVLYGLEIWKFHALWFGSVGMGAIPVFSYLTQAMAQDLPIEPSFLPLLFLVGAGVGYIMLGSYERTKADTRYWKYLAIIFPLIYLLGFLSLL